MENLDHWELLNRFGGKGGEGHDFAPQYTAMSGDIVGSLPVGIQFRRNTDLPYYSAMNCYNHKRFGCIRWHGGSH